MRIRLDIAYDGTHFRGWALQPGLRTVQGTLEGALGRILGGQPRLVVAGRTDAGVHATGQVAHVDLDEGQQHRLSSGQGRARGLGGVEVQNSSDSEAVDPAMRRVAQGGAQIEGVLHSDPAAPYSAPRDSTDPDPATPDSAAPDPASAAAAARLAARMRGVLGAYSDVAVLRTMLAPAGFDARFSAVWRRYSYRLADDTSGYDPLERHRTTRVRGRLDVGAMDAAARSLIGLHDFAAYCKPRDEGTTIRTLLEFDWHRDSGGVLVANVRADAFCHSMVRALVGACVAVGQGRLSVKDVADLRDERERTSEFAVLAARGLTLTEVGYPDDALLATRAAQTRGKRTLE